MRGSRKAMARQFDVVVERGSDGFFVASVPALAGCHTQARCLEIQGDDFEQLDFVGIQRVTV